MQSRVMQRLTAAVAATVALWSLSACDSGGGDAPTGSMSDSAPASGATSSDSPSASPSWTVTPASGEAVENDTMSYRLPTIESKTPWSTDSLGTTFTSSTLLDEGIVDITATDLSTSDTDLEVDAGVVLKLLADYKPRPRRVANRVINGVECWVMVGKDAKSYSYRIGGLHAGRQFSLLFDVPATWTEADQRIEEILASIKWK